MSRKKRFLLYTLFCICVLSFFIYARFPDKAVENYILAAAAESYPAAFLSFGAVSLSLPPGLKLENIMFGFRENSEANIQVEKFTMMPRLLRYVSGRSAFTVNALAYGGSLKGSVDFPGFSLKPPPAKAEIIFEGLNIEKCAYLKDKLGRAITGKLGGTFIFSGDSQLDFTIQKGSYQLLEGLFGFERLDFNKVEGQLTIKGGVLRIVKLRLTGDKINCSLKGEVMLKSDLKDSEINLNGTIEIANLNKKISVLLTGTMGRVQTRYI